MYLYPDHGFDVASLGHRLTTISWPMLILVYVASYIRCCQRKVYCSQSDVQWKVSKQLMDEQPKVSQSAGVEHFN